MMRFPLCVAASFLTLASCTTLTPDTADIPPPTFEAKNRAQVVKQASDPYFRRADTAVRSRISEGFVPRAKNVIIFIGDGMGISTVTAARIYAGQKRSTDGESYLLNMEKLPHSALSRTYSHDYQVADSAATATAMVAGVKTRSGVIGVRSGIARGNCASGAGQGTDSLFEMAERRDLSTGIISTARITHATPASAYAKSADRNWENDNSVASAGDTSCKDIARQMIDWPEGDGFEVVLGGGRQHFMTDETFDPEYADETGRRSDEKDLIAAWTAKSDAHETVFDGDAFAAVDFTSDVRILGLFEPSHMKYEIDRAQEPGNEPSIAEMTEAAITRLSQDEDGYVLMVEGGRIDHAHHGINAARALEDTDAFDLAVAKAVEMTDPSETLIIVTADHSHTMTMAGYPRRNNPILGKVVYETGAVARAGDGKPYTTLSYANGTSGCVVTEENPTCERENLSDIDTEAPDYRQQATVFMQSETHAGEDVAIFASGPGSQLVRGVMDQNEIFHVMGYSSGLLAKPEPDVTE